MVNCNIYPFIYDSGSQNVAPTQQHQHFVRNTISWNLLEMEIFRPHLRSSESEAVGVEPSSPSQQALQVNLMQLKFKSHLSKFLKKKILFTDFKNQNTTLYFHKRYFSLALYKDNASKILLFHLCPQV